MWREYFAELDYWSWMEEVDHEAFAQNRERHEYRYSAQHTPRTINRLDRLLTVGHRYRGDVLTA